MGASSRPPEARSPRRQVFQADALAWMDANAAPEGACVITSLPDVSELAPLDLAAWRAWFVDAARRVIRWAPLALFYQSDVRHGGAASQLIDKGHLVHSAADAEDARLVFHKIVCRAPPGTISLGRPSYSHLLGVSRAPRPLPRRPGPDVLADAGPSTWTRGMGIEACRLAIRFARDEGATVIVDPFCGHGTVLAVANAMGLDAIGVDLGGRRVRKARTLTVTLEGRR